MSTLAKDILILRALPQGSLTDHLLRAIAQVIIAS